MPERQLLLAIFGTGFHFHLTEKLAERFSNFSESFFIVGMKDSGFFFRDQDDQFFNEGNNNVRIHGCKVKCRAPALVAAIIPVGKSFAL